MAVLSFIRSRLNRDIRRSVECRYHLGPQSKSASALYILRPDLFPLPDKIWKKDWDLKQYGLTEIVLRDLEHQQNGVCKVCGQPPSGRGHCSRLHIDHDHKTGKVRGLLCSRCNMALGHAQDSPERLRALASYLEAD